MTEQEIIKNERKATAELYLKQAAEIERLKTKVRDLNRTIDAINTLSGRCSMGHGDCQCGYCLIHKMAFDAWKMS